MHRVSPALSFVVADEESDEALAVLVKTAQIIVRTKHFERAGVEPFGVLPLPRADAKRKCVERLARRNGLYSRRACNHDSTDEEAHAQDRDASDHCRLPVMAGTYIASGLAIGSGISHLSTRITPNNIANAAMNTIHPENE